MARLVLLGVVAAFFFSSTFVLNRWMSVGGGHWFWTASLRYLYVIVLLTSILGLRSGGEGLREAVSCLKDYWLLWLTGGGIGFGFFYSSLCYAASYAPGWVVATTWQSTILATPLVLRWFGQRVPRRGIILTSMVFLGILLVNAGEFSGISLDLVGGVVPVLLAAVCYPVGNTLTGLAKNGGHSRVPHVRRPIMNSTFARVWMMAVGALPVLAVIGMAFRPPLPTTQQLLSTAYVAVSTGVIATSVFLYARHGASSAFEIAAVDATQAGEVPFALGIEWILFGGERPSALGAIGALLVVVGIGTYTLSGGVKENPEARTGVARIAAAAGETPIGS